VDNTSGIQHWLRAGHSHVEFELEFAEQQNEVMQKVPFILEQRAVEPFMKNGFVLGCPSTGQAAYIDPGDEVPQLLEWIDNQGIELVSILNTHGHMDHICGVGVVKEKWDVPICLHPDDKFLYDALSEQGEWFGFSYAQAPSLDCHLEAGQEVCVGDLKLKVHHTPGHSPGSVCFETAGQIFCGDLIFAGGVGRTDLPGGSQEVLFDSIRSRILPLGDEKVLHPGHGPATTVGQERLSNPFLVDFE
jgi:hydroxyacylglutathione hydrolase